MMFRYSLYFRNITSIAWGDNEGIAEELEVRGTTFANAARWLPWFKSKG